MSREPKCPGPTRMCDGGRGADGQAGLIAPRLLCTLGGAMNARASREGAHDAPGSKRRTGGKDAAICGDLDDRY
jgi:hypothetical protein